jgi:hypothetical protein
MRMLKLCRVRHLLLYLVLYVLPRVSPQKEKTTLLIKPAE